MIISEKSGPPSEIYDWIFPKPSTQFTTVVNALWEREQAIEKDMISLGIEALRKSVSDAKAKGRENNTVYGNRLISHGLPALTAAIETEVAKASGGKAGRLATHVKLFSLLPADVLAGLALVVIMQTITSKTLLQPVALAIGNTFEEELRRRQFREADAKAYKWTEQRAKKSSHQGHKRRLFGTMAHKAGVETLGLSLTDKTHIGVRLIELTAACTGFITLQKVPVAAKGKASAGKNAASGFAYHITPTASCLDWIAKRIHHCEALTPRHLPMVVPPKPWEGPFDGGYWSPEVAGRVLIKTPYLHYLEELATRTDDMPEVYASINAIQNTPWRVNAPVLAVLKRLWDTMPDGIAGLPPREPLALPPCPVCGARLGDASPHAFREKHPCFDACPPETLKQWRIDAARAYDLQTSLTSKRLQTAKIIWLAEKYQPEAAIWFPHQLDFRGRAYPMPAYLQPQGTDVAKGLLTFAEAKPLGTSGVRWLAIHLANTWGQDKVSLDDRVAWVRANEAAILQTAADPFASLWWTEADKPFQFLAACFEWAGYKEQGESFPSSLPIGMDGTCNGLQIFSLMLRDEEGGRATNLLPSDKPQDIYGIVAKKVIARLEWLKENGQEVTREVEKEDGEKAEEVRYHEKDMAARLLQCGIDRKTTKRQVMVVPYGGTMVSCREYTLKWLREKVDTSPSLRAVFPDRDETWKAAAFLATLVWEAIGSTVIASRHAMSFLQRLASLASKQDMPITWTTPLGFSVLQAYRQYTNSQVKTQLFGNLFWPRMGEVTDKLDPVLQRNGVSPNYVHSLDAAAMQHTVNLALAEGITSFRMVHDDYGTHAADTETLARLLRCAFIDLFGGDTRNNLLAKVRTEVARQIGLDPDDKKLPEVPPTGSLKVEEVAHSEYFFA